MSNDNPPNHPGQPQYGAPQPPQYQPAQYGQQAPQYASPPQYQPQPPQYGQLSGSPTPGIPPAPGAAPTTPVAQGSPGGQPGTGAYPPAGPPGYAPAGITPGGAPGRGPGGPQPKGSNARIIGIVVACVAVFAIVGGVIMFLSGRSSAEPVDQPTISAPSDGPTDQPSDQPTDSPTDPSTDPATPPSGDQVAIAEGVTTTLPNSNWVVEDKVSGGVLLYNKSALTYIQIQAFTGEKGDATTLCGLLQDGAAKGLGNTKKSACKGTSEVDRIKTASGSVTGTLATSNGSVSLGTLVLAGVRDDGLVTGTQVTFPVKKPPTAAVLKEAGAIWSAVIRSQNSA